MLDAARISQRRAGPADVAIIIAITRAAYAKWLAVIGREPKPMTADYAAAVRAHLIDLLEFDGQPIALIELIPAGDHVLIENIAVDPAYQGRRLGQRLLAHAEAITLSYGLSDLRLYTNKLFIANIDFYLAHGFQVTGEEAFRGGWLVHMRKELADPALATS